MGMIPERLTSPTVGFKPTTPFAEAGHTIEPSVSVPTAIAPRLALTATAEPELDPHGFRSRTGVAALSPASTPSTRRVSRTDIRPLAQVCLGQQDRSGCPESSGYGRIHLCDRPLERQRARRRGHPIGGVD